MSTFVDLPEGAGWTTDERFGFKNCPRVVLQFCWVIPNVSDDDADSPARRAVRALGGAVTMSSYVDVQRLPVVARARFPLDDASALEELAAKASESGRRSVHRWAEALCA